LRVCAGMRSGKRWLPTLPATQCVPWMEGERNSEKNEGLAKQLVSPESGTQPPPLGSVLA
ncbi:MAG TPA: hypothetical protein VGO27_08075, partial [Candidatus Acidoferrum sp.]|nr:hypothetical protein [Candidatus Acidoferrum sp.]